MGTPLPPIYRDFRPLLVYTEGLVQRFARYHKYTVGTDMRTQAMQRMRCVHRGVYEPAYQLEHVGALVWLVDNYKLTLQLAMEVGAFTHSAKGTPSFAGFDTAAALAAGIGKQCAGWQQATVSRQRSTNGSAPHGAQPVVRQHNGAGWYLQLDIHNFFNTLHRPTLYALLCKPLHKIALKPNHALALRSLYQKLLANKVTGQVRDPAAATRLPAHKRLANVQPGCGRPVGNLASQFFANVYLNAPDQFAKHTLKCKQYVRYVDDFVLIAHTPEQLRQWQAEQGTTIHANSAALAHLQSMLGSYWATLPMLTVGACTARCSGVLNGLKPCLRFHQQASFMHAGCFKAKPLLRKPLHCKRSGQVRGARFKKATS